MLKYFLFFISSFAFANQIQNPGFEQPSSLAYYPGAKSFVVSNLQGVENVRDSFANLILISDPFARPPKNKFRVLHSNSGKKMDLQAPIKLIIDGKNLIVGDSRQVALFELDGLSVKPKKLIPLNKIEHLKSMALAEGGDLYLSDHKASRIFKISNLYTAEHKLEPVTNKIPSPAGMLYSEGLLYVVSTSHNTMYVYNCSESKPEKKFKLTDQVKSNGIGFVDLCKGSEGEFYLLHKDRESVYLFNEEWSGKRGVKLFKNGLIAPRSIIYHAEKNALIVAQDFANSVFLTPALKMRPQ